MTVVTSLKYLLPLCDEVGVSVPVLETKVVELAGDLLLLVEHLVDVPASLVVDAGDGPHGFLLPLAFLWIAFGCNDN